MGKRYQCTECTRGTDSSLDAARMLGWRVWDGESVTGKQLNVRICPYCADSEQAPPEPSWGVGCRTCDWEHEDWDGEGPLAEKDARALAADHECESDIWVKSPEELEKDRARWDALTARAKAACRDLP